ncbi:nuclear transport factor 2 family protein [Streptomyces sp. NPDC059755]|uniref:nuclear transport factor 2 family protein n=1 Tax=Streptomyces sp. NPDC059755 TaxID=3346934 RepID=UPI00364ED9D4
MSFGSPVVPPESRKTAMSPLSGAMSSSRARAAAGSSAGSARARRSVASVPAVPPAYADDEGHVFVVGHYHAETKTGDKADVRFIHLWTVRDGKAVSMRQAADSHVLQEALKG